MKKYIITYGDEKCKSARMRFVQNALNLNIFDEVIGYSENDISSELQRSSIINEKRGGGLWSWKPDVILTTLNKMQDGDYLVYCDAGCTLYNSKEWNHYWKILENHDIIAQRIYQRTDKWTRRNIIDYFSASIPRKWEKCYQHLATVIILKVSPLTRFFVKEWRNLMIEHPEMVEDVIVKGKGYESDCFIENRHDQAIYSAMIYNYLCKEKTSRLIYTQWEHIEDNDVFIKQAIRATRLRNGEKERFSNLIKASMKRLIKDFFLKPFIYSPSQKIHFYQKGQAYL